VRSRLVQLGVQPYIAELVLGHVAHRTRLVSTYEHYDYSVEIADALARWATALTKIIESGDRKILAFP